MWIQVNSYTAEEELGDYLGQHALQSLNFILCIVRTFGKNALSRLDIDFTIPKKHVKVDCECTPQVPD